MGKKIIKTYSLDESIVDLMKELQYVIPTKQSKSEFLSSCVLGLAASMSHIPKIKKAALLATKELNKLDTP